MSTTDRPFRDRVTNKLPPHLANWQLPQGWRWGTEGVEGEHRHYQELVDGLGRSLSLVSSIDGDHEAWLHSEARTLAHLNHPSIPTTYYYWPRNPELQRGPGYLRRWIPGETLWSRLSRAGAEDLAFVLQLLRSVGSALAYMHSGGSVHGAVSAETCWVTPTGRLWLLGWEWAIPRAEIPEGFAPNPRWTPTPPESDGVTWNPTPATDQWQLAAAAFAGFTREYPPSDVPPLTLVRPDIPVSVAKVLARALKRDPNERFHSMAGMLRELDRAVGSHTSMFTSGSMAAAIRGPGESEEARLRWATGEDYEVKARLGAGTFGSVWRVRDLSLNREVALKMLHPEVSSDESAVYRFRREAQLAAQLAHPSIVPIYDWDSSGGVAWYTMELAEGGSLADLVARSGPRTIAEIAPQIDQVLDGLAAAHASGIIHRDLKPENILIDRYRRWRIADFGVAKIPGEEASGTTGTPEFAAPEQLLGEPQGAQVDLFEIAAITYFLLAGKPPFGTGDGRAILARELAGDVDLDGIAPDVAEWLRRGLAARPEDRFADANEMRDAWREAAENAANAEEHAPWWRRLFTSEMNVVNGES
ncbi:MAG: protein kinase domain-containing protein [Gemmatimonas sp.]